MVFSQSSSLVFRYRDYVKVTPGTQYLVTTTDVHRDIYMVSKIAGKIPIYTQIIGTGSGTYDGHVVQYSHYLMIDGKNYIYNGEITFEDKPLA